MHRRKKALKPPFVVTVSAAVSVAGALLACGGGVASIGDGSGSSSGGQNPPGPVPAGAVPCGPSIKEGDPCAAGATCGEICTSQPAFSCSNGRWQPMGGGCNPPANVCPTTEPTPGAPCSPSGESCGYTDTCESAPQPSSRSFLCSGGVWQDTTATTYEAKCPDTMPAAGASCASCAGRYPERCDYTPNPQCPPISATCDAKTNTWQVMQGSCNPPVVDAGP